MARSVVVLPAPLAPSKVTIDPAGTFRETPCSARMPPYAARTSSSSSSVPEPSPAAASGGTFVGPQVCLDDAPVGLDLRRRSFRDLASEVQDDHPFGHVHDQVHVVLDHQDGELELGVHPPK